MEQSPQPRPLFWPRLFIGAFVLGAILWCVWMVNIIQKTREQRDSGFFVPMAGQTAPQSNAAAAVNPAVTNTK